MVLMAMADQCLMRCAAIRSSRGRLALYRSSKTGFRTGDVVTDGDVLWALGSATVTNIGRLNVCVPSTPSD